MSGLLTNPKGKWIEVFGTDHAVRLRKSFYTSSVKSAKIKISGLGLFYLYINGKRASDDCFVPARTDYHERNHNQWTYVNNDTFTYRTLYMEYDVTELIEEGENVIGVLLGNGWYNQTKRITEGMMSYGFPRLFFELEIENKNGEVELICSDDSVRFAHCFIKLNDLFHGEFQNLNLYSTDWLYPGFDDSKWDFTRYAPHYEFAFEKQEVPGDKKIREIKSECIAEYEDRKIYDLGENITGWVRLKLTGEKNEKVVLRFAEEIIKTENQIELDFSTCWIEQIQTDTFICDGQQRYVEPYFTFHGFRYFEVCGNAEEPIGIVIHTPIEKVAEFNCDNDTIQWIFDAYIRSELTNIHMSFPSDCPHREKLGYTGDGQITADSAMWCLDLSVIYKKWIRDILDCQDIKTGHVQHSAPYNGGGGGPGGWGSAIVIVPYMHYKHYRNKEILKNSYDYMCKWVGYMQSVSENNIVVREDPILYIGDWSIANPLYKSKRIPANYVNTYFFVRAMQYMKEICNIIGRNFEFDELLKKVKDAIVREYYDENTGSFANGINGADAFALDIGIGNERTLNNLVERYKDAKDFDTGIFGTEILIRILCEYNFADIALKLLSSEGQYTYYTMKKLGATTLYESMSASKDSHNHPMFGSVVASLFNYVAGLKWNYDDKIYLEPVKQSVLQHFGIKAKTINGDFGVKYDCGLFEINSPVDSYMIYDNKKYDITIGKNIIDTRE